MSFPDRLIFSLRYLKLPMSYTRRHLLQGSLAGGATGVLTGLARGEDGSGVKAIRKKPRGIIFCVSDGMSQGVLSMTEAFSNQVRGKGSSWWNCWRGVKRF